MTNKHKQSQDTNPDADTPRDTAVVLGKITLEDLAKDRLGPKVNDDIGRIKVYSRFKLGFSFRVDGPITITWAQVRRILAILSWLLLVGLEVLRQVQH